MRRFMDRLGEFLVYALALATIAVFVALPIMNVNAAVRGGRTLEVAAAMAIGYAALHVLAFPASVIVWNVCDAGRGRRLETLKLCLAVSWRLIGYQLTAGSMRFGFNKDLYALKCLKDGERVDGSAKRLELGRPAWVMVTEAVMDMLFMAGLLIWQLNG